MGARLQAARTRSRELHQRQLRSAAEERADASAGGRRRCDAGNFGGFVSRTHAQHASHYAGKLRRESLYISDLIPTTKHLDLTWVMAYDLYPLETIQNRKRFYRQAIGEKWLTIFTHDHEIPWGYLEMDEKGKVFCRK